MAGEGLIDWSAPWFESVRGFTALLDEADPRAALGRAAQSAGLRTWTGHPLCFVDGADAGEAGYERHVAASGRVPTRLNVHDLLNALAWLAFPRTKAVLNALHVAAFDEGPPTAGRGPLRDAATLLDESGLLLACTGRDLAADLRAMRWESLFVSGRERFAAQARPFVLGHALLDKLRRPYKAICAHVWIVEIDRELSGKDPEALRRRVDEIAAGQLREALRSPRDLYPLPLLGIPGWWPANAEPAFYSDPRVFRPSRAPGAAGRA